MIGWDIEAPFRNQRRSRLLRADPGSGGSTVREPQPRRNTPKCPAYLDERARQEWRRLVPILTLMKVLTEADGLMLGNLCLTVSTLVKAQEKLNQLGILYKSPSGYVMQSPLLSVVNQCVDTITKLSREFGLTPASRPRLTIEKQDDTHEDELMTLLSLPRESRTNPVEK